MKRRDLIKRFEDAGWYLTGGTNHDMAKHPEKPGTKIPIPRHREIEDWKAKEILNEAGLK